MEIMKKLVVICMLFVASITSFGQQEVFFSQANDLYNKGAYEKAIALYTKVLDSGQHSSELYYNLANAYYKTQEVGPSVYYYEKALSLAPNDKDILINYGFAKQTRVDKIEAIPQGVLKKFYKKLMNFPIDFWGYIALIGSLLFVLGFVFFYLSTDPTKRKVFFGIWVLSIFIAICALSLAFSSVSFKKNHVYAILFEEEISVQSEPNLRSEQLFKLHEGTKMQLLQNVDNWTKIKLEDGKTGWLTTKSFKKL